MRATSATGFGRRMEFAGLGPLHLEHRILRTVVDEVMGAVFDPAVQYRLVAVGVVAAADPELLLHPGGGMLVRKAAFLEGGGEDAEQGRRHGRVATGPGVCVDGGPL